QTGFPHKKEICILYVLNSTTERMQRMILTALLLWAGAAAAQQEHKELKLWYRQPATEWTEALPVGNGRLGAMIFGGTGEALIQLNEATLWSGGPVNNQV